MSMEKYLNALGPLAILYNNAEVVEIMVDAYDKVIVDRKGKLVDAGVRFESSKALRDVVDATLNLGGVILGPEQTSGHIRFPDASRHFLLQKWRIRAWPRVLSRPAAQLFAP